MTMISIDYANIHANNELLTCNDSSREKTFYHPDHLGSTSVTSDAPGQLKERITYLPYGSPLEESDELYQFTSQEWSGELGIYDYGARQYNPVLKRFMQADTVIPDYYNPQLLNRYSYVGNNPLKYVDPTGNFVTYVGGLFTGGGAMGFLGGAGSTGIVVSIDHTHFFDSPSIIGAIKSISTLKVGGYGKVGGGLVTPTASGAIEGGIAPLQNDIKEFEGITTDIGGDVGQMVTVGVGASIPEDPDGNSLLDKFAIEGTIAPFTDANLPLTQSSGYIIKSKTKVVEVFSVRKAINTAIDMGEKAVSKLKKTTHFLSNGNNYNKKIRNEKTKKGK